MALNTDSTNFLTVRRLWSIMSSFKDKIVTALGKKSDKSSTVSNVAWSSSKLTKTINGTTTDVVSASTLKSAMSLNNVTNDAQVKRSEMGTASGVATLDANGIINTSQLPSYVDDVLEYSAKSQFPATGETGKIYVDTSTNLTWRWSGTTYVEISPSLALGETSSTAYRGDRGKIAYDHSQVTSGNPYNVTAADVKAVRYDTNAQGLTDTQKGNARTNIGAPPTSHASSATTYGIGTTSNYGHVKLYDSVADENTDGAPTQNAVHDALEGKADANAVVAIADATVERSSATEWFMVASHTYSNTSAFVWNATWLATINVSNSAGVPIGGVPFFLKFAARLSNSSTAPSASDMSFTSSPVDSSMKSLIDGIKFKMVFDIADGAVTAKLYYSPRASYRLLALREIMGTIANPKKTKERWVYTSYGSSNTGDSTEPTGNASITMDWVYSSPTSILLTSDDDLDYVKGLGGIGTVTGYRWGTPSPSNRPMSPENYAAEMLVYYTADNYAIQVVYRSVSGIWMRKLNNGEWDTWAKIVTTADISATSTSVTIGDTTVSVPQASNTTPIVDGTAAKGSETAWARGDHVHPTDTSREDASNRCSSIRAASSATDTAYPSEKAVRTELDGKANIESNGYIATSNIPVIQYRASSASTLRICRVPSPSTSTMSVLECNVRWADTYARIIIQSRGWVANVIGASLESYGLAFYRQAVTVGNTTYYDIIAVIPSYCRCVFAASFLWYNSNLDFSVYGNVEYTPVAADKITYSYSAQALDSSGTAPVKVDALGNLSAVPMDTEPTADSTNLMTSGDIKNALDDKSNKTAVVAIADAYARASNVSNMWCKVAEFTWTGTKSTFASSWMVTFIASSGAMTSESFFLNFAIRANESGAPTLRTFVTSIINTPSTANTRRFKMVISGSSGNMTMKLYYFNGTSNYSSMTIREITATAQSSASKSKGTWAYTSYASGEGETTEPTGDYNYECTFVYANSLAVESADALNVDTLGQAGGVTDFDLLVPAVNKVKYYTINGNYTNGSKGTASTGYWGELQVFWRNSVPYQVYLEWNANGIIYFCRYASTYDSTAAKWIWNAWAPFRAGFDKDGNNISSTYFKIKDGVSFSNAVRSRQTESGSGWGKVAEWTGALTNTQVTASWNAFTTYKVDNIGRAINAQISLNVGGSATATDVPVVGTFKVVATEKSATTYDFCLVVTGTNASCTIQLYILSQYNTSTSLSMIDRGRLGLLKDKAEWTYSDSSGGAGGKPAADASTNKYVYSPQYVYTGTTQEGLGTCAYYSLYTANTSSSAPGWVKLATVTKSSATYQGFRLSGYFYNNNGNQYATKGASGIHFQAVFTATNNTASLLYGPSDLDVANCVRIVKTASSPLTWELQFNFGTNNTAYAVYASYEGDLTKLDNEIKIERDTVAGTTGDGVLATITPKPDTTWHTSYALWQNLLEVGDANSAIPASPRKDKGGSVGEYYVSASASNVPSGQYSYHIRTSVYRYSSTVFRGTQLATASYSTPVSVVYERSGTSSDGTTWTWGTWNRVTMSSDLATATVGTAKAYDTSFSGTNSIATALAAKQPGRVIVAPTYSGGVWSNDFATVLEAIEDGKDVFLYTGNSEGNVDTYHMVPLTEVVKSSNNYMAFQFSRPRVWSSNSENGILDTWTCTATSPYWQFEGKNVYYAATAGEAFSAANASNYSSGGTIESTFSAINTALAGRALGKTITLASANSLSVTIPWATRTGRSSMLAIVSGNNGVQSCVQVSWFKDANNSITNAKMNVLSYTNTGAGCVPMFYVQYGTQALGACGIYLVLDNSSWATQVTVIPNMENVDSVAFGYVAKSTAQTATDLSSARVWNLQGAWDGTPTSGSTNAVTSNGIYDMTQGYKIRVVGALPGTPDANTIYLV